MNVCLFLSLLTATGEHSFHTFLFHTWAVMLGVYYNFIGIGNNNILGISVKTLQERSNLVN
jgi:hypothetical protein